jgi:XisH protein
VRLIHAKMALSLAISVSKYSMPAKDIFHDCFKAALVKDGWNISHDPYNLKVGKKDLFIDLGAEKLLAAERGMEKIAVEIKSFVSPSEIRDLEVALGQYVLYQNVLMRIESERTLYLAIRESSYLKLFEQEIGQILLENQVLKLLTFNHETEEIVRWIG